MAAAGALGQGLEELAARPEGVGDPLVAVQRGRGPQLAGDLSDEQVAAWDRGLVDLGQLRDRR
jgi:hypothetical protein